MSSPDALPWLLPFLADRDPRKLRPYQLNNLIKIQAGLGLKKTFYTRGDLTRIRLAPGGLTVSGTNDQGLRGSYVIQKSDEPSVATPLRVVLETLSKESNPDTSVYEEIFAHCMRQEMPDPVDVGTDENSALKQLDYQLRQLKELHYDPFSIETDYEYLSGALGGYPRSYHPVVVLCTRFDIARLSPIKSYHRLVKYRRLEYEDILATGPVVDIGTFPYRTLRKRVYQGTFRYQDWTPRMIAMIQMDGTLVDARNDDRHPSLVDNAGSSLFSRVSYLKGSKTSCRPTVDDDGLPIGNELSYRVFASLPAAPTPDYLAAVNLAMTYSENPSKQGSCGYGEPITRDDILTYGCDQLSDLPYDDSVRQVAWILDSIDRLRFSPRARRGRFRLSNNRSNSGFLALESERTGLHPLQYLIRYYDLDLIYEHLGSATMEQLQAMGFRALQALTFPHWLLLQTIMPIQLMDDDEKYQAISAKIDPSFQFRSIARGYTETGNELPQWYLDGDHTNVDAVEPASIEAFIEKESDRVARSQSYIKSMAGGERGGLMSWAVGAMDQSTIL